MSMGRGGGGEWLDVGDGSGWVLGTERGRGVLDGVIDRYKR